jgi:hypothetical protein
MEITSMEIALGLITLVFAICVQTVAIGYFIGGIKTVVVRLVKDVEEIGARITVAINDLVLAKRDIQEVSKIQCRHETKIELLESKMIHIEEHLGDKLRKNYSQ